MFFVYQLKISTQNKATTSYAPVKNRNENLYSQSILESINESKTSSNRKKFHHLTM